MSEQKSENQALIDFLTTRGLAQALTVKTPPDCATDLVGFVNGAGQFQDLTPTVNTYRRNPLRRVGTIEAESEGGFIALTNQAAPPAGCVKAIFVSGDKSPEAVTVADFHEGAIPGWCGDRIRYAFPISGNWQRWTAANKRSMPLADFAEFIEANMFDIGDPTDAGATTAAWAKKADVPIASPSALLSCSRGLSIRVEEDVTNAVRLASGETQMVFTTRHTDKDTGEQVKVPAAFHLLLPIFRHGAIYSVPVRLRYRASGGKVSFSYEIQQAEVFLEHAIRDVVARIEAPIADGGTGIRVYRAAPPDPVR